MIVYGGLRLASHSRGHFPTGPRRVLVSKPENSDRRFRLAAWRRSSCVQPTQSKDSKITCKNESREGKQRGNNKFRVRNVAPVRVPTIRYAKNSLSYLFVDADSANQIAGKISLFPHELPAAMVRYIHLLVTIHSDEPRR